MIRQSVSVERVLEVLNRAIEADREAIANLISQRVPCNDELAVDPDIQVGIYHIGQPTIGVLGLINGFFGNVEGWGAICAEFELKCAQDATHEIDKDEQYYEGCPECGSEVTVGNLIRFARSSAIS